MDVSYGSTTENRELDGAADGWRWAVGLFAVAAVWAGLLLGVSFLATPAKFLAPSLSLSVALDVGRHTFAVFNKLEWLLAATVLLMAFGARARLSAMLVIAVCLVVVVETFWLLPLLDQRAGLIILGQQPPASNRHSLYILLELAKLAALIVVSIDMTRRLQRPLNPS